MWLARHRETRLSVAVKLVTASWARELAAGDLLRNEVRSVAALEHPGIVAMVDYGEVSESDARSLGSRFPPGTPWLAMELVDGGSLESCCGILEWHGIHSILRGLLDALAHAHARAVVHRDIKPSNVLLTRSHQAPRLTDFGLAHATDQLEYRDTDRPIMGTPAFMAPEQFENRWRDFGPWTDLYSLGCLAWALACGPPPFGASDSFEGMKNAHLEAPLPPFTPRVGAVAGLEVWLAKLLAKKPEHRFQRAADAAWALEALWRGTHAPRLRRPQGKVPRTRSRATAAQHLHSECSPNPPNQEEPAFQLPSPPLDWREGTTRAPRFRPMDLGLGLFFLRTIPFLGRERERDIMWSTLLDVQRAGKARVLYLEGPAGYGKSRLARWLTQRAHELGAANILKAVHSPIPGPADGLLPMLARHYQCAGLPRHEVGKRLAKVLDKGGNVYLNEHLALTDLITPPGSSTETHHGTAFARDNIILNSHLLILRSIGHVAAERPVILWLEDLHCSLETLCFVEKAMEAQENEPFPALFLLLARDDRLAGSEKLTTLINSVLSRHDSRRIYVGPLKRSTHAELVRVHLGLDDDLALRVEERTAGNPLFAVQLVQDWIQRGLLVRAKNGFTVKDGARVDLPDNLHQVWTRTLDEILAPWPREQAHALEIAAVLGQEVYLEEWQEACSQEQITASMELLDTLIARRLVYAGEAYKSWFFTHGMLRESLERRAFEAGRLKDHHMACAAMLHGGSSNRAQQERLGRHLVAASAFEASLVPLSAAASKRLYSGDSAIAGVLIAEHRRAIEALELPLDDPRWGETWILESRHKRLLGDMKSAEDCALEAEKAARHHGWTEIRGRALEQRGRLCRLRGCLDDAWHFLEAAAELAIIANDRGLEALCQQQLGYVLVARGDLQRAGQSFRHARAVSHDLGDELSVARCMLGLSQVARQEGRYKKSNSYLKKALERFHEAGSRAGLAGVLFGLGEQARLTGKHDQALQYYEKSRTLFQEVGMGSALLPMVALAMVHAESENHDKAMELLETSLDVALRQDRKTIIATIHAAMLPGLAVQGRWKELDNHLEHLDRIMASTRFVDLDIALMCLKAAGTAITSHSIVHARKMLRLADSQLESLNRQDARSEVLEYMARLPQLSGST